MDLYEQYFLAILRIGKGRYSQPAALFIIGLIVT